MEIFNSLEKGKRVWTSHGYINHGPVDGNKENIPGENGGEVVSLTRPYSTMDSFLYEVRWDSGHVSKHYNNELEPIGTCRNLSEYEQILKTGRDGRLILGPQGGFKSFEMIVQYNNLEYFIKLGSKHNYCWQRMAEILKKYSVDFETEILASKRNK